MCIRVAESREQGGSSAQRRNRLKSPRRNRRLSAWRSIRKHTEKMLRRYLYASMQVGRAPSILGDPIGRGWVSSRPVRTFEDAVIFVLDVEKCLNQLGSLDRQMLSRIVLQEYTQARDSKFDGDECSHRLLQISAGSGSIDREVA